jgi:hypothetical protein
MDAMSTPRSRLSVLSGHLTHTPALAHGLATQLTSAPAADSSQWFKGRVVIITGAAKGIGRDAAFLFARHGASLVIADLDTAEAQKVSCSSEASEQCGKW